MGLVEGRGYLQSLGWGSAVWGAGAGSAPPHKSFQQQPLIVTMAMLAVLRLSSVVASSMCWDGLEGCAHSGGHRPPRTQTKTWGPLHRMGGMATKPSGSLRDEVPQGDMVAQGGAWRLGPAVVRERRVKPFGVTVAVEPSTSPTTEGSPPSQAYNYRRCPWRARRGYVTSAFGKFFLLPYRLYKYLDLGPGQAGGKAMTRAAASPHARAPPATVPQFPHLYGQKHPCLIPLLC